MKKQLLIISFILMGVTSQAQLKTITGNVSDESGPLPGATILVKGTKTIASSDFDGNYSLTATIGNTLVFSYLGYKTQEIIIGKINTINVILEADTSSLEEVVVVGYATQTKRSIVSAVSSRVFEQKREKRREADTYKNKLARQLQGTVTGVQANAKTIAPKTRQSKNRKAPLYIVDGTPIQKQYNAVVSQIDPATIDKINTYNKYKAKQLFGEIANNGCIVISTKSGNYQIENDENYASINENQFEKVALSPLSTFSIDVDKASYSNVRRMINAGQNIPVDAVKIEEMINYFEYSYPQPEKHPFSITTEMVENPWNTETNLVRIGLQGKTHANEALPPSNLTFLIDVSGSMGSTNKLPLLKSAFKLLVNQLREKDKVSIVVYAGAAGMVLAPTSGAHKEKIINAINNLEAGGSTAGGAGIELAYKLAAKNYKKNGNNRVILATDGDFNVGASSNNAMMKLIEEKRKSGVFLSVLGFGIGNYKDSKLETLADKGNGNHAYIDTMQEAQKVFGKEFGGTLYTIAKDVKIQVEFNPSKVKAYRLIGYENRLLNDEDFVDDTKDAGELGSGHRVTALYEVIPVGVKSNFLKEDIALKYTSTTNNGAFSDELLTVKFRYKLPKETKSQEIVHVLADKTMPMSTDFKFTAAVALFGMQLRKSQFSNNSTLQNVLTLAEAGRGTDKEGYRAEFIRLVKAKENNL